MMPFLLIFFSIDLVGLTLRLSSGQKIIKSSRLLHFAEERFEVFQKIDYVWATTEL
jgi:hypothetical protein